MTKTCNCPVCGTLVTYESTDNSSENSAFYEASSGTMFVKDDDEVTCPNCGKKISTLDE